MTTSTNFDGDFEAHLTVRGTDAERLEQYAAVAGVKFARIVLARGRVTEQPMLTVQESGAFATVRDSVLALRERLEAEGFPVVRTKIEAAPSTAGVPVTDAAAVALGGRHYFEHHIKLCSINRLEAEQRHSSMSGCGCVSSESCSSAGRLSGSGRLMIKTRIARRTASSGDSGSLPGG